MIGSGGSSATPWDSTHLADDPRFASNALRTENHAALEPVLEQVLV